MKLNYKESFFSRNLMKWGHVQNSRIMPWKGETDPYKIWLSEIILQQTRVEQGWKYFIAFTERYTTIKDLAAAPETEIYKLWEGLGYYSRCKNLIYTAKFIADELDGKFPADYQSVLRLKGVGPYTAAAITSFAFNLPYAVVDGNVMRVLARFFGIKTPIDANEGKKIFAALADRLLDKELPGLYNQAIMDFGAVICKPRQPLCLKCILSRRCSAFLEMAVNTYPVKSKTLVRRHRWFNYILVQNSRGLLVRKRVEKDIWQNLYEFFLIESDKPLKPSEVLVLPAFRKIAGRNFKLLATSRLYRQQLTHQTITGFFIHIRVEKIRVPEGCQLVNGTVFPQLPFPRFIINYIADNPALLTTQV